VYYQVPIVGGELDIDYSQLVEAFAISENTAVVLVRDDAEVRPSWQKIDLMQYLMSFKAGFVKADRLAIKADGFDTATVTAEVHPDLAEITFYHADTGETIAVVPVDPATYTATLQVTATTPGIIRIRAGEPIATKLNEVLINASA